MLRTALGPAISGWLDDPTVIEVVLNPDGRLWVDRLGAGIADAGKRLTPADGERIVRLVAHHVGVEVHAGAPRLSAELPEGGERFEGLLSPVVTAPTFAIRKPAVAVFTLDDYAAAGVVTAAEAMALATAVAGDRNILVAGGTGNGKTTLANALLAEVAKTSDRVVLIEDTRELQCAAPNLVAMRTKDGVASLSDLVRSALRLRPDRIPIGEHIEPIPQRIVVLRKVRVPTRVPIGDAGRRDTVLHRVGLDREVDLPHHRLQAAGRRAVPEGVRHQLVEQRGHRDMRIARHGVAERQRAVRGQLGQQPIGERPDNVVLPHIRFDGTGRLTADGDNRTLHNRGRGWIDVGVGGRAGRIAPCVVRLGIGNRCFVFGPDVTTIVSSPPSLPMLTKTPARAISAGA